MNIIPTDLIAENILVEPNKTLGVVNEVVISCGSNNCVLLLVDLDRWSGFDKRRVIIPYSALIVNDSGDLYFNLPTRLLKACVFDGDHRLLQQQSDMFFSRIIRAFEFWQDSIDYFSNANDSSISRSSVGSGFFHAKVHDLV